LKLVSVTAARLLADVELVDQAQVRS